MSRDVRGDDATAAMSVAVRSRVGRLCRRCPVVGTGCNCEPTSSIKLRRCGYAGDRLDDRIATGHESATAFDETDGRDDGRHTSPVTMGAVLAGRYEIRSLHERVSWIPVSGGPPHDLASAETNCAPGWSSNHTLWISQRYGGRFVWTGIDADTARETGRTVPGTKDCGDNDADPSSPVDPVLWAEVDVESGRDTAKTAPAEKDCLHGFPG
jgi:hypothetical protein